MPGWSKRILRSKAAVRLAAGAIYLYVRFVYATSRWQSRGQDGPEQLGAAGQPFIVSFWHGRLLMMPLAWTVKKPLQVLISHHRDGELIARAMDPFGLGTIRGSTAKGGREKGGAAALRSILQALKQGCYIAITPDGPRGPRMRASTGAVAAARLAKAPIFPLAYGVARRKVISSWDRFIIPLPLNRGIFLWGEPIDVHSDTAEPLEQAALRLEAAMNALYDEADRLCGQTPVAPADRLPAEGDA